nr:hypothetical protein [uncultured Porphyromonas sp.]
MSAIGLIEVSEGLMKATEWRRVGGTGLVGEGCGCVGRWGLAGRLMLVVGGGGGAISLMSAIGLIEVSEGLTKATEWRRVGGAGRVGEGCGCVGRAGWCWVGWDDG